MWPFKKGLGIQLSYGVKGNGTVVSAKKEPEEKPTNTEEKIEPSKPEKKPENKRGNKPEIEYPILNDPSLSQLSSESITLVPKQTGDTHSNYKRQLSTNSPAKSLDVAVLSRLLHTIEVPSEVINSSEAYDPTYGKTIEFFHIKSNIDDALKPCIAAYASGAIGHILNVALVEPAISGAERDLLRPRFTKGVTLELEEPIKQIEAHKGLSLSNQSTDDHILIRTSSWLYVINVSYNIDIPIPITLKLVDRINIKDLKGNALADVVWSPNSKQFFLLIDCKGNIFKVKLIKSTRINVTEVTLKDENEEQSRLMENSLQLSNWRKVLWLRPNVILVATRSSLSKINLEDRTSEKIITAETWSRIRDIDIPKWQLKYMFILTSREIIWLDISGEPQRLISWKHFLNDKDPSLKLSVCKTKKEFICVVFCLTSPLVLCCSFGVRKGRPYFLSSPSLICLQLQEIPIQHLSIVQINPQFYRHDTRKNIKIEEDKKPVFGLFDLRLNLELSFTTVRHEDSPSSDSRKKDKHISFDELLELIDKESIRPYSNTFFGELTKKQLFPLVRHITKPEPSETAEVEKVQEYAFKLGEGVDVIYDNQKSRDDGDMAIQPSYRSLLDLSDDFPDNIKKVEELDTMLGQLKDYYGTNGIDAKDTIDTLFKQSEFFLEPPAQDTIVGVHRLLKEKLYSLETVKPQTRINTVKRVATHLILSSTKVRSANTVELFAKLVKHDLNTACSSTKAILNSWDTVDEEETPTFVDTQRDTQQMISSVPSIVITSQDQSSQKKNKKKSKKDMRKSLLNSQHLQSQRSQAELQESQVASQTQDESPTQSDTQVIESSQPSISSSQPLSSQGSVESGSQFSQSQSSQASFLSKPKSKRPLSSKKGKKKRKLGFA